MMLSSFRHFTTSFEMCSYEQMVSRKIVQHQLPLHADVKLRVQSIWLEDFRGYRFCLSMGGGGKGKFRHQYNPYQNPYQQMPPSAMSSLAGNFHSLFQELQSLGMMSTLAQNLSRANPSLLPSQSQPVQIQPTEGPDPSTLLAQVLQGSPKTATSPMKEPDVSQCSEFQALKADFKLLQKKVDSQSSEISDIRQ